MAELIDGETEINADPVFIDMPIGKANRPVETMDGIEEPSGNLSAGAIGRQMIDATRQGNGHQAALNQCQVTAYVHARQQHQHGDQDGHGIGALLVHAWILAGMRALCVADFAPHKSFRSLLSSYYRPIMVGRGRILIGCDGQREGFGLLLF